MVATVWKDTKAVNFLSVAAVSKSSIRVWEIHGRIDRNDQMTRVRMGQKQMWWYMHLVIKFIEISTYNAYLLDGYMLEHEHEPQGSKTKLVMELLGVTRAPQKTPGCKRRHIDDRLLNVGRHFPEKGEGKNHRCTVCLEKRHRLIHGGDGSNVPHAAKTTFKCSECNVYLCIFKEQNCLKKYHPQVEFWRDRSANDNGSSDSEDAP